MAAPFSNRILLALAAACLVALVSQPAASAGGSSTAGQKGPRVPGAELWVQRYNGPGSGVDVATSLGVSSDGTRVFVTGYSSEPGSNPDFVTLAYDALTGSPLWDERYDGPDPGFDVPAFLGVSPDGTKVFVTGASGGTSLCDEYPEEPCPDFATIAYEASTGTQLWVKRYDGPVSGNDSARSLMVSPDGTRVFVTGESDGLSVCWPPEGPCRDYATVAYDVSTGTQLWVKRYTETLPGNDHPYSLGVSPDGTKVFVTGASFGTPSSSEDYATIAYDASTGLQLWVMRYNGPGSSGDAALAMDVSPDGTAVFVTGESGGLDGSDYATVAYNASSGATLWVKRYTGPSSTNSVDFANSLRASPDGTKVFVTGSSAPYGLPFWKFATIAYDASTGAQLWAKAFGGPVFGGNYPAFVGVSPDGTDVFVTGGSQLAPAGPDYATIAYDAPTGAQLWVRRYNGPGDGNDYPSSIGVSPDGSKVFVTGDSWGLDTWSDYATIAYSAS